jgi:hypothetical protein
VAEVESANPSAFLLVGWMRGSSPAHDAAKRRKPSEGNADGQA